MLRKIAPNKYKLMVIIIALYLGVDVWMHKGQTRMLLPKIFGETSYAALKPQSKAILINTNKNWKKGINTPALINKLDEHTAGFECDVYFDTEQNVFSVHHDAGKPSGFTLDSLLKIYQHKKLSSSIWLDVKNLADSNATKALQVLAALRGRYDLQNKLLVESAQAGLLTSFSDSGFFTSCYVPFFNPYQADKKKGELMADSIASAIGQAKINALSGYYFQQPFLHHYFPQYPVLIWTDHTSVSLVNYLFRRKMTANKSVFILLNP